MRSHRNPSCAAGRANPGACALDRSCAVSPFSGRAKPLPPAAAREVFSCVLEIIRNEGNAVSTAPVSGSRAAGEGARLLLQGDGHPRPLPGPSAASNGMTPYRPPCSAPKPVAINLRPCAPPARNAGCCLCKRLPGHLCGYQVTDPLCGILGNGGALALQHPLAV